MNASPNSDGEVADVAGIGFGPSNLALAIALDDADARCRQAGPTVSPIVSRFFEAQPQFGWHRGMLIDGATMQVSFLKDLVTMRNPASPHSFLCYLHARGRLVDFINLKTFYAFRTEFQDYFAWAAESYADRVTYGARAAAVRPVTADGRVGLLSVDYQTGEPGHPLATQLARNVVIATGISPRMPAGVAESARVLHSSRLLPGVAALEASAVAPPRKIVVVGAGQSGAEVVDYLNRKYGDASIYAVYGRYGYSSSDDTPFANQVFNPEAVDSFYGAPGEVKQAVLDYHANTNYSVVDSDLIEELYRRSYLGKLAGQQRLHFLNTSRLHSVTAASDAGAGDPGAGDPGASALEVVVESLATGQRTRIDADLVVCATGYSRPDPLPLLAELLPYCKLDDHGRLLLRRDYSVMMDDAVGCGVYVQGYGEHSHGLGATLLSLTAVRAGEIAESLIARRAGR